MYGRRSLVTHIYDLKTSFRRAPIRKEYICVLFYNEKTKTKKTHDEDTCIDFVEKML